jgi:hypothetical protein
MKNTRNQWTNKAIKIMIGMGMPTIHKRMERMGFSYKS